MSQTTNWKKTFLKVYAGQALSLLTSSAAQFSIIWWLTLKTESALSLTVASLVGLLPQAVLGSFAGVWIDRFDRKLIMILADAVVALSSMLLFLAFLFGFDSIALVYTVLFIRALGETFHKPSLQALIPQLVPLDKMTKVGGAGQFISSACTMLGPMIGALLMSISSLAYVMLMDVLGALLAVLLLLSVKTPSRPGILSTGSTYFEDLKEGFRVLRSDKALRRLSLPMFLSTIVFVPMGTLFPLMVKVFFNGSAWHNGLVQSIFSAGMLASAMVIGFTGGLKRQFLMISLSTGLLGVCAIVSGILPPSLFWVFCAAVFFMGCAGMGFNIPFTAYIQKAIPAENIGKVLSLVSSIMSFAAPIGMFIAGPISEVIGISNWLISAGLLMLLIGFLTYLLTRELDGPANVIEPQQLERSI